MSSIDHINYFKIENFKRFESLEINNVGQFNLIVGDNNVGKSSLLEALLFEGDVLDFVAKLLVCFIQRYDINFYNIFINHIMRNGIGEYFKIFFNKKLNSNEIIISLSTQDKYSLFFKDTQPAVFLSGSILLDGTWKLQGVNYNKVIITQNNRKVELELNPPVLFDRINSLYHVLDDKSLIPFSFNNQKTVAALYNKVIAISKNLKREIIEKLKILIPNIEDIQISLQGNAVPTLETIHTDSDTPMPLSVIGDGANKIFRILLEIAVRKNKRLMIDEIDTGIHYSRLKNFWRSILTFADAYNVQIFATSHNIECLKYFKETLEEPELNKFQARSRIFSMKDINGQLKVYTYTFPEFQNCIDINLEMR